MGMGIGMATTEFLPSTCLLACLLAGLPACLLACLLDCLPACLQPIPGQSDLSGYCVYVQALNQKLQATGTSKPAPSYVKGVLRRFVNSAIQAELL